MATLLELHDLFTEADLLKKVGAATMIAIKTILDGTPDANDRAYAAKVFDDPHREAHRVLKYVLAAEKDSTVAQITGATDVQIQTRVDAAVPILADADAGA